MEAIVQVGTFLYQQYLNLLVIFQFIGEFKDWLLERIINFYEYISNLWNIFRNFLKDLWGTIRNLFRTLWNGLKGLLGDTLNSIWETLVGWWNSTGAYIERWRLDIGRTRTQPYFIQQTSPTIRGHLNPNININEIKDIIQEHQEIINRNDEEISLREKYGINPKINEIFNKFVNDISQANEANQVGEEINANNLKNKNLHSLKEDVLVNEIVQWNVDHPQLNNENINLNNEINLENNGVVNEGELLPNANPGPSNSTQNLYKDVVLTSRLRDISLCSYDSVKEIKPLSLANKEFLKRGITKESIQEVKRTLLKETTAQSFDVPNNFSHNIIDVSKIKARIRSRCESVLPKFTRIPNLRGPKISKQSKESINLVKKAVSNLRKFTKK